MALGCLLWVSWICFMLFDGTAGFNTKKGYRYPYDTRNLGIDGKDEEMASLSFDWQGSIGQPADPSYTKPSVAKQPAVVPTRHTMPNAPKIERLINGVSIDWGLENLNKPLIFPYSSKYQPSNPAKLQPDPVKPQSSQGVASDGMNAFPSPGGATKNEPNTEPEPSPIAQTAKPPGYYWQQKPVHIGRGVAGSQEQDSNTGTFGGDLGEPPHLVYEEVFQYPSENAAQSQTYRSTSETAGGNDQSPDVIEGSSSEHSSEPAVPRYPDVPSPGKGRSSSGRKNLNSGQIGNQPQNERSTSSQQKPVGTKRVSMPIPPPLSYIIQSRNGYQRFRYLSNKYKYTPLFYPQMPVKGTGE